MRYKIDGVEYTRAGEAGPWMKADAGLALTDQNVDSFLDRLYRTAESHARMTPSQKARLHAACYGEDPTTSRGPTPEQLARLDAWSQEQDEKDLMDWLTERQQIRAWQTMARYFGRQR